MLLEIGARRIGPGHRLFAIAEIGLNHGGSLADALAMIRAAAAAGASAVKMQTLRADTLVAPSCPAPVHVAARNLVDFFRAFELSEDDHAQAAREARHCGPRRQDRRSVYAARDLRAGELITPDAIVLLRPAIGLEPRYARELIGRPAARDVTAGSPFCQDDLASTADRSISNVA